MKKLFKNPLFWLCFIIVVGVILRLLDINRSGFWYDEAFTGDTILKNWREMFIIIARDKVHPPTYYVLVKLWSYIFGATQDSLRGFSMLWGVLTIPLAYFFGKRNFDLKEKFPYVGIALATVFAVSPFFVGYSLEARSYSLLSFTSLLAVFFFFEYINSKQKRYLYLSSAALTFLLFTHFLQIVFILGFVCAYLLYKYVYNQKGLNIKLLSTIVLVSIVLICIVWALPIEEFLLSKGLQPVWWIPKARLDDIIRMHFSYVFGVVRDAQGVTPFRDFRFSVNQMYVGGALFFAHILGLISVIKSDIDVLVKRKIFFLFSLSMITFIGFMSLSLLAFNTVIERYTIAAGTILILSMISIFSTILGKNIVYALVIFILVSIFGIQPMPRKIDYRVVTQQLQNLGYENTDRFVFKSPVDMIGVMFYMSDVKTFYQFNFKDEYASWALVDEVKSVSFNNITKKDIYIVFPEDVESLEKSGFKKIAVLDENRLVAVQKQ